LASLAVFLLCSSKLQEQNEAFFGWNDIYSQCSDGCVNGSPRGHAYLCASAHHDAVSCMFPRWSHELDWGDA
jgi:hypothetical protein